EGGVEVVEALGRQGPLGVRGVLRGEERPELAAEAVDLLAGLQAPGELDGRAARIEQEPGVGRVPPATAAPVGRGVPVGGEELLLGESGESVVPAHDWGDRTGVGKLLGTEPRIAVEIGAAAGRRPRSMRLGDNTG